MGEQIKILAKGIILDTPIEIELNHALAKTGDQQIHIQSDNFRFEIDKKDYIKYAMSILVAAKNLKNLKRIS